MLEMVFVSLFKLILMEKIVLVWKELTISQFGPMILFIKVIALMFMKETMYQKENKELSKLNLHELQIIMLGILKA
ncbi:hypothetical protein A163_20650 [Vibrio tasmaniensis 1F-267]|uniref:Uncharacterized protein n=1 Tax=Vibrio tasmaniensis 1F-267 TaxID=1191324 RepID=A0ABX3BAS1_9VIBR|nr:hypothetical protein A163_20650 [Vibrio tasmaniensis 1F-267]OEF68606.1 hypothetical protein A152_03625 [Vibrio tasmaniensis 1F-187]OEF87785.1 hypothetical protein A162_08095 [Vibrio tasmaniensis 1F-155]